MGFILNLTQYKATPYQAYKGVRDMCVARTENGPEKRSDRLHRTLPKPTYCSLGWDSFFFIFNFVTKYDV